jgi:putative endonuclease
MEMKRIASWLSLRSFLAFLANRRNFAEMTRAERGRNGEKAAELHLKKKGFRLIQRNWRQGRDEIDLICVERETLVFVEVRTREENALVSGYHSVGSKKKRALLRVCKAYLRNHRKRSLHYRFDLVEVRWNMRRSLVCLHYENVALFPDRSH